jgi:hypothetical protein
MAGNAGYHYFMVSAQTREPSVFWDSDPDSGYSGDNMAPGAVKNLAGTRPSNVQLHWNPNNESDLQQYAIYRNGSKIAETADTSYIDDPGGSALDYVVTAIDIHGNEGLPSSTLHFGPTAVSMSQMACYQAGEGVVLNWRTESETDCARWIVERSGDLGFGYLEIGKTDGQGNSSQPHDYIYTDNSKLESGNYYYRLTEVDLKGNKSYYGPISVRYKSKTPAEYVLNAAYPNPSRDIFIFRYQLKDAGQASLRVYNLQGQLVRTLVNARQEAGYYEVRWNSMDETGQKVSTGIYLYRLEVNGYNAMKSAVVIK